MASFSIPNQDATIIKELVISDNVNKHLKSIIISEMKKFQEEVNDMINKDNSFKEKISDENLEVINKYYEQITIKIKIIERLFKTNEINQEDIKKLRNLFIAQNANIRQLLFNNDFKIKDVQAEENRIILYMVAMNFLHDQKLKILNADYIFKAIISLLKET
ncbi:MAG: hypothetical protein ACTTGJ_03685 [Clostridium sp.]